MATYTNASSLSGVRSYDLAKRRERLSQPKVRSTIQRFGWISNRPGGRVTISTSHNHCAIAQRTMARYAWSAQNHLGELDDPPKFPQRVFRAVSILDISRRNDQRPQQAQRIHDNVPLSTGYLFFPRRSREARLVRSSLRSGCRARRQKVWASFPPLCERAHGVCCGSFSRCRLFARGGNNKRRSGTAADRAATRATCNHCG